MKDKEYWENRANKRMAEYHKNSDEIINKVNIAYDKAMKDIYSDIKKIFETYYQKNDLSPSEAKKLINSKISKKEIKDITDKIKYIKDNGIRKELISILESQAYGSRITRLEALKLSLAVNTKSLADVENKLTTQLYTSNINKAYYSTIFDIQKGIGIGFSVAELPNERIQEILKTNWSGKHYSKRIWSNTDVLADKLQDTITSGMMSGKSVGKMANELDEVMTCGKFAASRLIRTETTYVANQSELQSYKECDIEKYVFIATLDSRTSEVCREHDGKIYEVTKAMAGDNLPPLHPHCRSTTIAYMVVDWLKGIKRRAKDENGKSYTINYMNYVEWQQKYVA